MTPTIPATDPRCGALRRAALPYLDGELPPGGVLELEAHRDACPDCAEFLRVEREFNELLKRNLRPDELPAGLEGKIRGAIAGERRMRALRAGGLGLAAVFTVSAVSYATVRLSGRVPAGGDAPRGAAPAAVQVSDRAQPHRVLRGELICIHCRLYEKYHFDDECAKTGHRGALLLPDGDIVFFSDETSDALRKPPGPEIGREVEVEGDYAPHEKFIRVANYRVVRS